MSETTKPNGPCQFTEKDLLTELSRFREVCGDRSFWDRPEAQRKAMITGLTHLYLNTGNDDGSFPTREQTERWGEWFADALHNYNRRETMLTLLPLKRHLGIA